MTLLCSLHSQANRVMWTAMHRHVGRTSTRPECACLSFVVNSLSRIWLLQHSVQWYT